MSWIRFLPYGPPRISDPDSWEGRMAREHAHEHTLAKWQHQRWVEAGIISQPSDAWGTPTWYPRGVLWTFEPEDWWGYGNGGNVERAGDFFYAPTLRESDPPEEPYAGAAQLNHISIDGVNICEYIEAFNVTAEETADSLRHMIEAAERAASDVRGAIVSFRLYRIEDDMEGLRAERIFEDDLSTRPLTDEDFQRWQDAIDYEPTIQGLDASAEPQSDDASDLLDRIATGVRGWEEEKEGEDRGDT